MNERAVPILLLNRAAHALGGLEELERVLGVSHAILRLLMDGKREVPDQVLLRVIDLLDAPLSLPRFDNVKGFGSMPFWSGGFLASADPQSILESALAAAMKIAAAPMGNVQLNRSDCLVIKAQKGFYRRFLDFFACVRPATGCACGEAMRGASRIVVADVRDGAVFGPGSEEYSVMLEAGAISVQSTPVRSTDGRLLAVFSTHDGVARDHSRGCEEALDLVARRLGDWLSWRVPPEDARGTGARP